MCEAKRLECETIQLLPQDVGSRISAFLHEPDPLPWAPGVAPGSRPLSLSPEPDPLPWAPRGEGKRLEWMEPLRLSRGVGPLVSGALPPAVQCAMAASASADAPQPAALASPGPPQPAPSASRGAPQPASSSLSNENGEGQGMQLLTAWYSVDARSVKQ